MQEEIACSRTSTAVISSHQQSSVVHDSQASSCSRRSLSPRELTHLRSDGTITQPVWSQLARRLRDIGPSVLRRLPPRHEAEVARPTHCRSAMRVQMRHASERGAEVLQPAILPTPFFDPSAEVLELLTARLLLVLPSPQLLDLRAQHLRDLDLLARGVIIG